MMPGQPAIEIPLLQALAQLGGEAKPKMIYPLVTARFSQLTDEDLAAKGKHGERI